MGLALGTFMEVLDTSIANVAVPTISGSLGVATSEGTWVISSYSVASAIAVPLTGWLARRVGEVKLFTISVVLFSIASALCGLAHNFESLIAFRLLQGLVSGPMVPLSQTILMRSYPPEKRGLALGLWAMTVIVAPIFGPVMGGYITDNFTWPWIFYINVPIGLFSALIAYFLLRGHETKTTKQRIDAVGLALLVIGVSSLQMMLDLGKDHDWFNSSFIVALAIVAAVVAGVHVRVGNHGERAGHRPVALSRPQFRDGRADHVARVSRFFRLGRRVAAVAADGDGLHAGAGGPRDGAGRHSRARHFADARTQHASARICAWWRVSRFSCSRSCRTGIRRSRSIRRSTRSWCRG